MFKNTKKNTIILLLITIIILYFILRNDFNNIVNTLKTVNILYIILASIIFFISVALKGYSNYLIINDKKKISLKESIKHNVITQFFNGITPFSTGGQPMEIYMMTEHNISLSHATNYSVQSFIFYQIALVLCGLFAVTYNSIFKIFPKVHLLQHLVLLGFTINVIVVVVLLLIANSRKVTDKLTTLTIKICHKFKIGKTDKEIKEKYDELYLGFRDLSHNKKLTIQGIILNILSLLFLYVTPLFVIYSMGDFHSVSLIEAITSSAYIYLIGAFVPIPGASGGIEFGFNRFFSNFIRKEKIGALLLIWRFVTYYLPVIIGGLIFSLEKKEKK